MLLRCWIGPVRQPWSVSIRLQNECQEMAGKQTWRRLSSRPEAFIKVQLKESWGLSYRPTLMYLGDMFRRRLRQCQLLYILPTFSDLRSRCGEYIPEGWGYSFELRSYPLVSCCKRPIIIAVRRKSVFATVLLIQSLGGSLQ